MAGVPRAAPRPAGAGRRSRLGDATATDRRAVLEPVARPRRGAVVVARPPAPAVRAVPRRARQPGARDRPAGGHRARSSSSQTTVVLAMDVSRSMCSTDIEPNRLIAAEEAASSFVQDQRGRHADRYRRVRRLRRDGPGTDRRRGGAARCHRVAGDRSPHRRSAARSSSRSTPSPRSTTRSLGQREHGAASASAPPAVPEGAFAPAIIVLLTDGASNTGPEPVDAAQQAVDRGIRVYTIGFGTENPGGRPPALRRATRSVVSRATAARGSRTRGSAAGGSVAPAADSRRAIDEETLHRGRRRDRRRVLPGRGRAAAHRGLPPAPDRPDHEPRGRRDQRRVHGDRRGPDLSGDPARAGLAAAALGRTPGLDVRTATPPRRRR